jgi:hypothetical protein
MNKPESRITASVGASIAVAAAPTPIRAAQSALMLSRRIEHDGIATSGEATALTMIRHASIYRQLLADFDGAPTLQADVPVAVDIALAP